MVLGKEVRGEGVRKRECVGMQRQGKWGGRERVWACRDKGKGGKERACGHAETRKRGERKRTPKCLDYIGMSLLGTGPTAPGLECSGMGAGYGIEGCWKTLEAWSALVCKICTSAPCPRPEM